MARIAFSMLNDEPGHLHPAIAFARLLRRAGHDVLFVGLPDDRERVETQGFSYFTLGEEIYGNGVEKEAKAQQARWRARPAEGVADAITRLVGQAKLIRGVVSRRRAIYRFLVDEARSFRRFGWDLLIHDYHDPTGALVANKAGIRCICLSTSLVETNCRVPPLWTDLDMDNRFESLARVAYEWKKQRILHTVGNIRPDNILWAALRRYNKMTDQDLRQDFEVSPLRIRQGLRGISFNLPTLIACPQAFDFEHPRPGNCFYIEPLVDLERKEAAFDWAFLRPDTHLVYASMGTQSWLMERPKRFFKAVMGAMANQSKFQMILNVGSYFDPSELGSHPNVIVVQSAPQLEILARASLMITHGGLNSIKECVMHGVPMLAFPVAHDQPGNAARLRHHSLGLTGDYRKVEADQIRAMCHEIVTNPLFTLSVSHMREKFVEAEAAGLGVEIVEQVLALPARFMD